MLFFQESRQKQHFIDPLFVAIQSKSTSHLAFISHVEYGCVKLN